MRRVPLKKAVLLKPLKHSNNLLAIRLSLTLVLVTEFTASTYEGKIGKAMLVVKGPKKTFLN